MVILVVDDRRVITDYKKVKKSKLIKCLLEQFGDDHEILIPSQYSVLINHYLDYLDRRRVKIEIAQELILYLKMATYFEDTKYFSYLMECVHNIWTEFRPLIKELHPDIQREIYLYIPYLFIPTEYTSKNSFINEWMTINANKIIVIDKRVRYHTDVEYYNKQLKSMHTYYYNHKYERIEKVVEWYSDRQQVKEEYMCESGKIIGLYREWYAESTSGKSNQLKTEGHYEICDGSSDKDGLWREWWPNGGLKSEGNYFFNQKVGKWLYKDIDGNVIEDKKN